MKKREILQFEADDASEMGANGKQVFFTKRINGETIHNKINEENAENILAKRDKEKTNNDDLFIELNNLIPEPVRKEKPKKKKVKKKNSKQEKLRRKRNRIIRFIILIFLFLAVGVFALVSPIFNIKNIEVEGNDKIDSSTIESLSGIQIGKNIFKINKNNIISNIKESQYIDKVSIKRKLPGTVQIIVDERKIAYQVKVINSYVYLDYQGYILEVASSVKKVPQIVGLTTDQDTLLNGKRLSNKDIKTSINTLAKIMESAKSADIWNLITTITIKNNEYILDLNKENKIVYLGKGKDLTNMMMYVKAILQNEKESKGEIYVNGDLNSGFKPYFREVENE